MAGIAFVGYVFLVALAVIVVWQLTQKRQPAALPERLAPVIAAARRRAFTAVAFAVVVFIAAAVAGVSIPALLGVPLAVAPLIAGASGLLLYAATPPRDVVIPADQPRSAALVRRSWFTTIPTGWLHGFVEVIVLFIVVIVFCGSTASADDLGLARAIRFEAADRASTASPYPGWFYGIPVLIALGVLIAATVIALQRIGATSAFPHAEDAEADQQWRRASASVVLSLALGAVLFVAGGVALAAGQAMGNAIIADATPALWSVMADVLLVMGFVSLILSIVSITLAALTAFTIGDRLAGVREVAR